MATRALDELAEGGTKGRFGEDVYRRARSFVDSDEGAATPQKQSFKEAFAAARKAGDKKFTWNGKSYTTELAAAPKPKAVAPVEPAPASYSSREAASDFMREAKRGKTQSSPYGRGAEGADMYLVKRKAREIEEGMDPSYSGEEAASDLIREAKRSKPQTSPYGKGVEGTDMYLVKKKAKEIEEYKKGGCVKKYAKGGVTRADGCATKGKTKGRMVWHG